MEEDGDAVKVECGDEEEEEAEQPALDLSKTRIGGGGSGGWVGTELKVEVVGEEEEEDDEAVRRRRPADTTTAGLKGE